MACYFADNVHTKAFTPREFQVELVDAAKEKDVAICLNAGSNKTFVLLKVIQELSNEIRVSWVRGGKRTLYVGNEESVGYYAGIIAHLTDLRIGTYLTVEQDVCFSSHQVLLVTWEVCADWATRGLLDWSRINLLIVDGCHNVVREHRLRRLVDNLNQAVDSGSERPRILGLTKPLFTSGDVDPGCIEAKVKQLECDLRIQVDTASEIVSTLRYSAHPKEFVVECGNYSMCSLSELLKNEVNVVLEFLGEHRYDPTEIYDDCFTEELKDIPDPKKDPYDILDDFVDVLNTMGPWCADKAALVLLVHIEKLKVKTPYERHFLLLCIVSTALFKMRAICDSVFEELPEVDRIMKYSSPKILRLIEIVRQFKPRRRNDESTVNSSTPSDSCDKYVGTVNDSEADSATKDSIPHDGSSETNDVDDPAEDRDEAEDESKIPVKSNHTICFICGKMNCSGKPDESTGSEVVTCSSEETKSTLACNGKTTKSPTAVSSTNEKVGRRNRWRGRGRFWRQRRQQPSGGTHRPVFRHHQRSHHGHGDETDNLCGIIFVHKRFTAKMLYHLFHDLRKSDPDFVDVNAQYTVGKIADPVTEPREAEIEHRKQEDVLKRFRMRDCNLVVTTSVLEEGIELPRCNLIVRFDAATDFKSHANSKSRARHHPSFFIVMIESVNLHAFLATYSKHIATERLLLSRSANSEPSTSEESAADVFTEAVPAYKPSGESDVKVTLSTAISLVNRYCAKLPSDTFTRLAPLWWTEEMVVNGKLVFFTSVRLPINSPVKETIIGYPMPTKVLSRRIAALETCRKLHQQGELDDNFEPIGKEAFNAGFELEDLTPSNWDPNLPRPGTTKSRQYYYKRIASCLNDCRPTVGSKCVLYNIDMVLTCPLPEEQNTRGRRLHPPELAPQAFGILTLKKMPKVCPFPIFTRSGEVRVSLSMCDDEIILSERHIQTISAFLNFVFTSVLRLQKYLMSFDPQATENSFFIVPTKKNSDGVSQVDWDFLELIYEKRLEGPVYLREEARKDFQFDSAKYLDAVVMPWYRNQDQPQYFYVAEICTHLSPKSEFPGSDYKSFEDYYLKKYGIQIQNLSQPLLDVDHTSARLNFLTPRYVNRKGVALPTSSEETKKAKRENLEQKQILVAELCSVHVLPASLWRQAVCLPCILYRINALLLADEIRLTVASEIGLGLTGLPQGFEWPSLDFGWSLADVLKKSNEEKENKKETSLETIDEGFESNSMSHQDEGETEPEDKSIGADKKSEADEESDVQKEEDEKEKDEGWMEIGTWSNDMAHLNNSLSNDLPDNLTMVRYGSPTSWNVGGGGFNGYYSDVDSDDSTDDDDEENSSELSDGVDGAAAGSLGVNGDRLRITFKGDFLAEAIEIPPEGAQDPLTSVDPPEVDDWVWESSDILPSLKDVVESEGKLFRESSERSSDDFKNDGILISVDKPFQVERHGDLRNANESVPNGEVASLAIEFTGEDYSMPLDMLPVESEKPACLVEPYCSDIEDSDDEDKFEFSFDYQPKLENHPGPSPSLLLQALTMSNANDGINLERLETIGDSFLKYAITTYLYCVRDNVHEGKLSHLRSKQVSNLKLYRLGQKKVFGECMIASKFEPHDNWLPPCYLVPRDAEQELLDSEPTTSLPYNLVTQHSIPDKSIADCVEALIGAYLIECGPRGALIFMSWLGIKVLPKEELEGHDDGKTEIGVSLPDDNGIRVKYGELDAPRSPLLRHVSDPEGELMKMMAGFDSLERKLRYSFNDKSYLLQAMTHASYSPNRLTDCYQRLEFLGDAVLDYLITRHLYEDKRAHSPGALTDLRSALVNNTIFASLAVKFGFHKYFRHLSPGLGEVVQRFVTIQEENSHAINEEFYLVGEEAEDVEVPKALGDVFESIAGAIYLDSRMSLDAVWRVYYRMMKKEIEQFSTKVPKSPIRELLELEPETAKFSKPEKLADGRRVRVTVEVFGKGTFKGIGRNYRIAKCTAAKCALKQLKKKGLLARKLSYYHSNYFYQR